MIGARHQSGGQDARHLRGLGASLLTTKNGLQAQKDVPAPSYTFFVSKLSGTVRDSIADR